MLCCPPASGYYGAITAPSVLPIATMDWRQQREDRGLVIFLLPQWEAHQLCGRDDAVAYQVRQVSTVQATHKALFRQNPSVRLCRCAVPRLPSWIVPYGAAVGMA